MTNIDLLLNLGLVVFIWACVTEFSYFPGRSGWLYRVFANSYETKWRSQRYSQKVCDPLFHVPMHDCLAGQTGSVLDLACGTGRCSRISLSVNSFSGQIVAVDSSDRMLFSFRKWLLGQSKEVQGRVSLIHDDVESFLSSLDGKFRMCCLVEATEFLPNLEAVIRSVAGALDHNGLFLLTKVKDPWGILFFPFRPQTRSRLSSMLADHGFVAEFAPWSLRYEVVYARIQGGSKG